MEKKMFWGIDMGVSSVGWAVTDENYELMRARGQDLWGVRLFNEASTANERRIYRTVRRRRQREIARRGLLREYFAEEINKVDEGFYQRLDESAFWMDDRNINNRQKYSIFNDVNITDKEYYKKYHTIYHLRKELLESTKSHDVRLVYLALASLYKRRGHFLNTSLAVDESSGSMEDAWQGFLNTAEVFSIVFESECDSGIIEKMLGEKGISRSQIFEKIKKKLNLGKKDKKQIELIKLICGLSAKIAILYDEEIVGEKNISKTINFRDSSFEEKEPECIEIIGEEYYSLIRAAKHVHDIGLLANTMRGKEYISEARVEMYDIHKRDLNLLKEVLNRYDKINNTNTYDEMFRVMKEGNYSAYVGSVNSGKEKKRRNIKSRGKADIYKTIKKIMDKLPEEDEDVQLIKKRIKDELFLPKQLTSENGVIPNQVFTKEMKKILENAENYLPFLKNKDESGLTVSERILQIYSFHLPYYVGPLGQEYLDKKGYNVWSRRIAPGKILPWNINEKIDTVEAERKFIERMVRHCSYLKNEKTLPKNSLLYEKFMVLNELNCVKIYGVKLSVEEKQKVYNELFAKGKKVTIKQLRAVLGISSDEDDTVISGIDKSGFKSCLASQKKFMDVLKKENLSDEDKEMAEKVIFWATIYGNDKKILKKYIEEAYKGKLTKEQIKRIIGYKFEGWGKLSREFLELTEKNNESGYSIIQNMWESNNTLMELLSEKFGYKERIDEIINLEEKLLAEWEFNDLDGLYISAPVKRMVWQTIKILRELETVTHSMPDRIFVEMTRKDGKKNDIKDSRKKKLLDLYESIKDESRDWKQEIESRSNEEFRIKKLYLYYLQHGKCMYTEEEIDIRDLFDDNLYDIDHIYPRHFVKDDSLENNLVLVKKQDNSHKSDSFPIEKDIQTKRYIFWKMLLNRGFISKEKFARLIRQTSFSVEEKANFVSRQLTETSQGTKVISQILKQAFPETEVVFSKAGEVVDFRKKFKLYKSRSINDLHHAEDAYLNIVVGNTYYVKFTANPLNFIRNAEKYNYEGSYQYHLGKLFERTVVNKGETAWVVDGGKCKTINTVKKVMRKTSQLVTKRPYIANGGITEKETIYGRNVVKEIGYMPVKTDNSPLTDITRYGGKTSINNMFYTLVEYRINGKRFLSLEAIPNYIGNMETLSDNRILEYLKEAIFKENKRKKIEGLKIKYRVIRRNSLLKLDGSHYYIAGKTGNDIYLENANPLFLKIEEKEYLRKIDKALNEEIYTERDLEGEMIISKEKNRKVYEVFLDKLQSPAYINKKNSIYAALVEGKEKFINLEIEEQCKVLSNVLLWFGLNNMTADLRLIGGKEHAGKCKMNKKLTDIREAILINQSVTGIFTNEVNLLTL